MNVQPDQKNWPTRMPFGLWWSDHVANDVNHQEVVERVREDAGWSSHFAFMTLMSAGIAVLGLLLSSPAVVIGAMLISPLMGPIIGLGFALATFDSAEIRRTARALGVGVVLAVLFCALIVLLSPLQTVTSEIAARTRPNLFDLLVALFSGLAGTYAMIRGRHGTIVGVAIATALMPPLAVVGFGVATANWTVLGGSALLFFTNLMTIAASAAVLARLYGFAPGLSPQQTRLQATLIIVTLIALAVPLGLSLRQIAWEALAGRQANAAIAAHFPASARITGLDIDYQAEPISVAATVLTPAYRADAERRLRAELSAVMGKATEVSLNQVRTETGNVESAQLAAAGRSAAEQSAERVAQRLALVAGVSPESVLIDRTTRRAYVKAAPLPGANLAAYRALEARVSASESGWNVILIPPAGALPNIGIDEEEVDQLALATAAWAASRIGLPIGVQGGSAEQVERVVTLLDEAGVDARALEPGGAPGGVGLRWLAPGQTEAQP